VVVHRHAEHVLRGAPQAVGAAPDEDRVDAPVPALHPQVARQRDDGDVVVDDLHVQDGVGVGPVGAARAGVVPTDDGALGTVDRRAAPFAIGVEGFAPATTKLTVKSSPATPSSSRWLRVSSERATSRVNQKPASRRSRTAGRRPAGPRRGAAVAGRGQGCWWRARHGPSAYADARPCRGSADSEPWHRPRDGRPGEVAQRECTNVGVDASARLGHVGHVHGHGHAVAVAGTAHVVLDGVQHALVGDAPGDRDRPAGAAVQGEGVSRLDGVLGWREREETLDGRGRERRRARARRAPSRGARRDRSRWRWRWCRRAPRRARCARSARRSPSRAPAGSTGRCWRARTDRSRGTATRDACRGWG
jgi:hypothetical protein